LAGSEVIISCQIIPHFLPGWLSLNFEVRCPYPNVPGPAAHLTASRNSSGSELTTSESFMRKLQSQYGSITTLFRQIVLSFDDNRPPFHFFDVFRLNALKYDQLDAGGTGKPGNFGTVRRVWPFEIAPQGGTLTRGTASSVVDFARQPPAAWPAKPAAGRCRL